VEKVSGTISGEVSEGQKLVVSIKGFGSPVGDILQRRPYVSQQSLLDATQPKGRRYYWKSEYLPDLKPELLAMAIKHAEAIASPHSEILLFPVNGALNRLPNDHSSVGNREVGYVQVKDIFYTPGGPHDAAIIIEAEGPEPINKFMASVQSLGNVKMKFIRAFSIDEMRKMV
jgi:hypothetical protein